MPFLNIILCLHLFFSRSIEWYFEPDEQPIMFQKKFFEDMGYTDDDKLEQQGRKDHGYLFTFIYSDRSHTHEKLV